MNLLTEQPSKLFRKYLFPSLGSAMVISIYIMADAIAIGKGVGPAGLSALNITTPLLCLIISTGLLFGIGGSSLMSYYFGQEDYKEGQNYFTISLISTGLIALFYWITYSLFCEQLLRMMGGKNEILEYAKQYMAYINLFIPVVTFSNFLSAFVRNDNHPNLSMAGVISGGVLNIILDYIFVFPLGMGMGGAALASALGMCLTVLIVSTHFFRKNNRLKLIRPYEVKHRFLKILSNGIPSFLNELSNGIIVCLFNLQILRYANEAALSVYSVISNCSIFFSSLFCGVGQAVQPLISTNYGASNQKRVAEFKKYGLITIGVLSLLFAGIGLISPITILKIFVSPTTELMAIANGAIRVFFFAYLFMGVNLFCSYYLQSTLSSIQAFVISLLRSILLSCFLVFLLPVFFGITGIWTVMPITEFLTVLLAIFYLKRG